MINHFFIFKLGKESNVMILNEGRDKGVPLLLYGEVYLGVTTLKKDMASKKEIYSRSRGDTIRFTRYIIDKKKEVTGKWI
jgi:hypothetical protein